MLKQQTMDLKEIYRSKDELKKLSPSVRRDELLAVIEKTLGTSALDNPERSHRNSSEDHDLISWTNYLESFIERNVTSHSVHELREKYDSNGVP